MELRMNATGPCRDRLVGQEEPQPGSQREPASHPASRLAVGLRQKQDGGDKEADNYAQ